MSIIDSLSMFTAGWMFSKTVDHVFENKAGSAVWCFFMCVVNIGFVWWW